MGESTVVTVTVSCHDHLDPACKYHRGVRAIWGMRWFYRCNECRRDTRK